MISLGLLGSSSLARWLNNMLNWLDQHDEKILRWVQILAFIAGGIWALASFLETEQPTLERHAATSVSLSWESLPSQNVCEAAFRIEINNNSRKSFDVSKIMIRVWTVPVLAEMRDNWNLLSIAAQDEVKPIVFDRNTEGQPQARALLTHYSPGGSQHGTLRFTFKKQPGTRAVLQADFLGDFRRMGLWKADFPIPNAGVFDFVCGEPPEPARGLTANRNGQPFPGTYTALPKQ